ncbi:acetylornithine deacetylase/succinyl-diaminopimelate desuccinylase [Persephonella hydrogeniphila]|uniref:Acetylornithine deacetylase/succinyl-diaminopimelate desuccinylase n=1 Tax=Persephonella hydrogeniphila TaxID=198703 RepID=A0A285NJS3_9AQUI|nr:M20/M25/M40 family metallo-hydrolase [Persephonella hydrogeniphila]SNZ09207.1 acetylornithine deacetylase/succinyl-diaminopimelate desuccinylase [Persephonella hydrogeniphila]
MERAKIRDITLRLKEELFRLISIPSHRDCDQVNRYIKERLSFIDFKDQPVGKRHLYNIYSVSPDKPVLINTHVDTVPPITMKSPFSPVEKNGKIYGRGANDTKGLIAALILAIEDFSKNNPDIDIPVSIAFTVDEEQNSALGSERLVEVLNGVQSILVLEPTYGKICTRQMGSYEFYIKVKLPSVHASEFEKFKNPSKEAFYFIQQLEKELKRPVNIIKFSSGWEHYAVPEKAEVLCEFKVFENELISDLEVKLTGIADRYGNEIEIEVEDFEEFLSFKKGNLFDTLSEAYRNTTGTEPKEGIMPSWTDASNFHRAGFECVVFGFGNLADCHTDRESISLEELYMMYKLLYNFLSILSQP